VLGARRAKATLSPAVWTGFEELDLFEYSLPGPCEDELGDPGSTLDAERRSAVVVYEGDEDLTAVPRVYKPGGVDQGNPVPHGKPATRQHEPRVSSGYGDGDAGVYERPPPWNQLHLLDRT